MASNADIEMRWVDAWNDVCDIINGLGGRKDIILCQLPDWSVVNEEDCRGWLQDSVYEGYLVRVETGWVGHCRGIIAHRWRETDA